MKHLFISLVGLILALGSVSCSRERENPVTEQRQQQIDSLKNGKILIVYLSRTQNTKALAEMIHQQVGGDLVPIELITPYPENYQVLVAQAQREQETGFLPPLKTRIDSIDKYEVVFVGFPTWGMQLPTPVKSFLTQYNLSGKTVVPFNTNAGYGLGSSIESIRSLCPNSKILQAYSTRGGIERDGIFYVMEGERRTQVQRELEQWLKNLNF
ncbi:MAG: flavodoxin [Bacteroidetes bacterium]|nr:flavodoxin [Bacteroidota bacterium]